ncbi:MAG: ABC transporter permease [Cyanobacteriota bacterium]|nr:ABC transporter permease [Cyanobacteriota bacterium]
MKDATISLPLAGSHLKSSSRRRAISDVTVAPPAVIQAMQLTVVVFLIASWEILARLGILDPFFWSMPSTIALRTWTFLVTGELAGDILFTSQATILGFILGTCLGGAIGLSFWWSHAYAKVVEPYLVTLQALPKIALAPILILALGIGLLSKVAIAIMLTVTVTAIAAYGGVKSVDQDLQKMLYSLGANRWQVFSKVVVPWSMPWIFSSLRINIGLALTGAIVGEYISSRRGLGRMIVNASMLFDMESIWVAVFTLCIMAMLMYWFVAVIEARLQAGVGASTR